MKRSNWTKLAFLVGLGALPVVAACSNEPVGASESDSLIESSLNTGAPQRLGSMQVTRPAALGLATANGQTSLVIASAGLAGPVESRPSSPPAQYGSVDAVRIVPGIDELIDSATTLASANVVTAANSTASNDFALVWPNEVIPAPEGAFRHGGLIVAGGSLNAVPDKTGRISFVDLETRTVAHLSKAKSGWIYKRVVAKDVNGDGLVDMLTARQAPPDRSASTGEILWLENPGLALAAKGPWKEHVLVAASEGGFRAADLDGDGEDEIIAATPSQGRLDIFWFNGASGLARGPGGEVLSSRIEGVYASDVRVADLNLDGRPDILAIDAVAGAGVVAYEVPADFKRDSAARFLAHPLIEGEQSATSAASSSSGDAIPFHPDLDDEGKPHVLVAGGAGIAYVLRPKTARHTPGDGDAASDWAYEIVATMRGGRFGLPVIADVNGDGFSEAFLPDYDRDSVSGWTFAPREEDSQK